MELQYAESNSELYSYIILYSYYRPGVFEYKSLPLVDIAIELMAESW